MFANSLNSDIVNGRTPPLHFGGFWDRDSDAELIKEILEMKDHALYRDDCHVSAAALLRGSRDQAAGARSLHS